MDEETAVFDAIVVGTGFGGAVTALRLTEAGQRICVLERGRRFGPGDFPEMPRSTELLPDTARLMWNADQGMWDVQDLDQVLAIQVAGYGGGSLGYASVHLVPEAHVFDSSWPLERPELEPYFALARHMLSLETIEALDGKLRLPITKASRLRATGKRLGRDAATFHPPLAIRLSPPEDGAPGDAVTNAVTGLEQNACVHCGACVSGCRHGAKNTLDHNYLALAERSGRADVRTLAEVVELYPPGHALPADDAAVLLDEVTDDRRWRVVYRDHTVGAARRVVAAERVFLCAGAVNTTRMLFRNRARLPALSDRLGERYFPNADALGVVYDTRERQNPGYGPTITTATVARVARLRKPSQRIEGLRFSWPEYDAEPGAESASQSAATGDGDASDHDWFMLQDGGYDPALQPILAMLRAPLLMGRNRHDDVGKFRNQDPAEEDWARREAAARRDEQTPERDYPRQPWPDYRDRFRDPMLGSVQTLLRSGKFLDYLPRMLGVDLPDLLNQRFRNKVELPSLAAVARDTQQIALVNRLVNLPWRSRPTNDPDDPGGRELNGLGRLGLSLRRRLLGIANMVGLDDEGLAVAAAIRSRQELGTDDIADFVLGWLRFLSNHDDAATAPFRRRAWRPERPDTFTGQRPDQPGEFVHMLLAMGRDTSPWRLEWRPPLSQREKRAREAEVERLLQMERWSSDELERWAQTASKAARISHAPEQDVRADSPRPAHDRERLEDMGVVEARPPRAARTTHTRGIAQAMPVYSAEERLMRDVARDMGGELRLNPRWAFAGQVVTVHSQGGCGMGADDDVDSVCDRFGRVRGHAGLYVQDGSLFPAPVGVNPSHTITALAERNLHEIRRADLGQGEADATPAQWAASQAALRDDPVTATPWTPPAADERQPVAEPIGIRFRERLTGSFSAGAPPRLEPGGSMPPDFKDRFLDAEDRGRAGHLLELEMRLWARDLASFVEAADHEAEIEGNVRLRWPDLFGDDDVHHGEVVGGIRVLPEADERRPGLESMRYALHLDVEGKRVELLGNKVILDDAGPDMWTDTTALFVRMRPLPGTQLARADGESVVIGIVRLGLADFVRDMVKGMEVTGTEDPARILWALVRLLFFFGGGLQRAYMPGARRFMERLVRNELGIR